MEKSCDGSPVDLSAVIGDNAARQRLPRCNPDKQRTRECDGRTPGTTAANSCCTAPWRDSSGDNYNSSVTLRTHPLPQVVLTCRLFLPSAYCRLPTAFLNLRFASRCFAGAA